MTELTNFFSTDYELKVKDMAKQGHVIHYVRVPTNSSDCSFLKNKEWLDTAIQNALLRCTITPKVHLMLKHVAWQMGKIKGGLGDKMEDWVERLQQTGMHLRQQFRTIQSPVMHAHARERVSSHSTHPVVIAHTIATNAGNKHSFSRTKSDDMIAMSRKMQRDMGRFEEMKYFEQEGKMDKLTW